MEDSLRVIEDPKGGLVVEWHPDDPRYKHLNVLTEDQITAILKESILEAVENQQ